MGMSTHVIGFTSPDNTIYQKHKKVLEACINADVSELPKETAEYFGSKHPEKHLIDEVLEKELPINDWEYKSRKGYELKVSDIPEDIYVIRFYNAW